MGDAGPNTNFSESHTEGYVMSAKSLQDVYADELKDLWSANNQMSKVVKVMADKASAKGLRATLTRSVEGIDKHTESIKGLLKHADEKVEKEHCRGMQGLVKEATKHITKEAPKSPELLDIVIIAQYQRMSHYGLAGFGTAAAYAKALGLDGDSQKIGKIVAEIHKADDYASTLAEHAELAASSEEEDHDDDEDDESGEKKRVAATDDDEDD